MLRFVWFAALALTLLSVVRADDMDDDEEGGAPGLTSEDRVDVAIDRGVEWLRSSQRDDGSWGPCMGGGITYDGQQASPECHETGPTSFALFTLLRCGVPRRDPLVKRGVKWLKHMEKTGHVYTSYEISSIILMLTAMYDTGERVPTARTPRSKPRDSPFRAGDWKWLHEHVKRLAGRGGYKVPGGAWGYWKGQSYQDLSATQFALLALRAASRAGYPVETISPGAWTHALGFTRSVQTSSGAMRYTADETWTAGMTAAGLANLLICREGLQRSEADVPAWVESAIQKALDDLGRHYTPITNTGEDDGVQTRYHYCYLYGIERVGALSGKHLLGSKPWYEMGVEYLVGVQKDDGAWNDDTCMRPSDVLGTCFALLFLKKATPPVVVTPSTD